MWICDTFGHALRSHYDVQPVQMQGYVPPFGVGPEVHMKKTLALVACKRCGWRLARKADKPSRAKACA